MFNLLAEVCPETGFRVTHFFKGGEMEIAKFRCTIPYQRIHCSLCNKILEDYTYWIVIEEQRSRIYISDTGSYHYHLHIPCALNKNSIILNKDQIKLILEYKDELLLEEL